MAVELIGGVPVDTETGAIIHEYQMEIDFSEAVASTLTLQTKNNGKCKLHDTSCVGQSNNNEVKPSYTKTEEEEEKEEVGIEEEEWRSKRWNN